MKANTLTIGALATLLLSSPIVGAEDKYPAADFKPKVQYQDSEYIAKESAQPAAAKPAEADSRYPATNFEPKVVYQDTEYKHNAPKVQSAKPSAVAPAAKPQTETVEAEPAKKAESSNAMLFVLIALAAIGFVLFKRSSGAAKSGSEGYAYSRDTSGATGVARYLSKLEGTAATGVAKYLEKQAASAQESVAATGVDKYLEKKELESETGVSKYLRTKG